MRGGIELWLCFTLSVHVDALFMFAFLNNTLYCDDDGYISDQGYQNIYGFMQLYSLNRNIPNVIGSIDAVKSDGVYGGTFAQWQPAGHHQSILWPEHDYWGWSDAWLAPFPIYHRILKSELNEHPWISRKNATFWTGALLQQYGVSIRGVYANCVNQYPDYIGIHKLDWNGIRDYHRRFNRGPVSSKAHYKPINIDSRRRLNYKFQV